MISVAAYYGYKLVRDSNGLSNNFIYPLFIIGILFGFLLLGFIMGWDKKPSITSKKAPPSDSGVSGVDEPGHKE